MHTLQRETPPVLAALYRPVGVNELDATESSAVSGGVMAIPAVLVAATVSPELALIVAGIYVILQFVEGNVLVPIVMRHAVGISPLLVLTSLLIGAAAGGFIGALLAVPIAASVEIILQRLQAREEPVAQDPSAIDTEEDNDEEEATQGATELKKALSD